MKQWIGKTSVVILCCFVWTLLVPSGFFADEHDTKLVYDNYGETADADAAPKVSGVKEVPGEKKVKKKFPLLLVGLGAAAVVAAVVLLGGKKDSTPKPTYTGPAIDMVRINGGTFQMGSTSSEAYGDEQPVHQVTLSSFQIGKYEVTQGQWRAVMGSNPSNFQKGDNYPVESVSWDDVQSFITKLNQMTGKRYRLPTEAEWEYAARGGTTGDRYGNLNDIAWYSSNSGNSTHPVGGKQPNAYDLYDMLGNVWEWVQDWYGNYTSGAKTNPAGPASGSARMLRGGSWFHDAGSVRAPHRNRDTPGHRHSRLGFRLAMDE